MPKVKEFNHRTCVRNMQERLSHREDTLDGSVVSGLWYNEVNVDGVWANTRRNSIFFQMQILAFWSS